MLRHWAGAAMAIAGAWLIRLAVLRRRGATEAAARGEAPPPLHPSLAALADVGPPIIIFGLFVAGGQAVLAFLLTGGGGLFSLFDVAGFLVLLLGYGVWVKAKVVHRAGTYRR
jgi:hypothetical protein